MERNIRSEVDTFLDNLKLGIILKDSEKIREIIAIEMPTIKNVNKLKEAMQLHKLAYKVLKDENDNISKEMQIINKTRKLNNAMIPAKKEAIYKVKA